MSIHTAVFSLDPDRMSILTKLLKHTGWLWTSMVYVVLNVTHSNKRLFPGNFVFKTSKVVEKVSSL